MEEEVDLRAYVSVLTRNWKIIVALALVAAVVAFVVFSLLPPIYQASSVVIITQPRYQMQFDPRFRTIEQWAPAYNAFPTLATSDEVLRSVISDFAPSSEAGVEHWGLEALSGMVEATSEGDPSLVVLKVRSNSAEVAATIANLWADVLAQRGNQIYSEREDDVAFFEAQVAQARQSLDGTDAALIEFQARNQDLVLEAQLASAVQDLQDYLIEQREIERAVRNARVLGERIGDRPADALVAPGDDLSALLLEIQSFDVQASRPAHISQSEEDETSFIIESEASSPILLQISDATVLASDQTVGEMIASLDSLVATLESRHQEIDIRVAGLEPSILMLQQQLQEVKAENDALADDRELARETYQTLARKLEEARISAREENGVLQVGSYAAVPEIPVGPRRLIYTALAGMLGLVLGVLVAFVAQWWKGYGGGGRPGDHASE
jgi:capsular polysaccharide biosynthesis protein